MLLHAKLPWVDPLCVTRQLTGTPPEQRDDNRLAANVSYQLSERYALLYSGAREAHSGRHSYLALLPKEEAEGAAFDDLQPHLVGDRRRFDNAWFGYLGYGVGAAAAGVAEGNQAHIAAPLLWMVRYRLLLEFDHALRTISVWADDAEATRALPRLRDLATAPAEVSPGMALASLDSNLDRSAYRAGVSRILEAIRQGDVYQANLTRKFFGTMQRPVDPLHLFEQLHARSPACYSCLLHFGDLALVSSSPERFLQVTAAGLANSRPIKGSAARAADPTADRASRDRLLASEKDRAENLMIVDLARNDLGRSCDVGSVVVDRLFELTTHATIHHLSSSISGRKRRDCATLQLVRDCFPPGSMTGAPKLSAMRLCAQLEGRQRGIYAGAAGWLGGDGSCDLAVVIRAIVVDGDRFEFQVGGGIVYDSDVESEWEETMTKARAVAATLGISVAQLRSL